MPELKMAGLFFITALAEIVGCYLPYLWLKEDKSIWLLLPAANLSFIKNGWLGFKRQANLVIRPI